MIAENEPNNQANIAPQTIDDCVVGNGRVLVMDDEEMPRTVMIRMLQRLGYNDITTTVNGEDAVSAYVRAMQTTPYDLVVLDLTIVGGMDGVEAAKEIIYYDPKAKPRLVSCSGYSNRADEVTRYFGNSLPKPYSLDELKAKLAEVKIGLKELESQE